MSLKRLLYTAKLFRKLIHWSFPEIFLLESPLCMPIKTLSSLIFLGNRPHVLHEPAAPTDSEYYEFPDSYSASFLHPGSEASGPTKSTQPNQGPGRSVHIFCYVLDVICAAEFQVLEA